MGFQNGLLFNYPVAYLIGILPLSPRARWYQQRAPDFRQLLDDGAGVWGRAVQHVAYRGSDVHQSRSLYHFLTEAFQQHNRDFKSLISRYFQFQSQGYIAVICHLKSSTSLAMG